MYDRNLINVITAFFIAFFSSQSPAAVSSASSLPVVYTGIASFPESGKTTSFITRLHLNPIGDNPSGAANYRAMIIYYLGDDGSNEYTTHHYGFVTPNPKNRMMILSPVSEADPLIQQPRMDLTFSEDLRHATGPIIDSRNEIIGSIKLDLGWTYASDIAVEQRYGGKYAVACPEAPHAIMAKAKSAIIFPTRAGMGLPSTDDSIRNDLLYLGSVTSGYAESVRDTSKGLATIGASFRSGRVRPLQRQLILMEFQNEWTCERDDTLNLSCRSPWHGMCTLTKTEELHKSFSKHADLQVSPIQISKPVKQATLDDTHIKKCADWNGKHFGFLRHRMGDRLQPLKITMSALDSLGVDGQTGCNLLITADLSFVSTGRPVDPTIDLPFGTMEFRFSKQNIDPTAATITPNPANPEIQLTVHNRGGLGFSFDWFSSIYGHVGEVIVSQDPSDPGLPTTKDCNAVYGLTDYYESDHNGDHFQFMNLRGVAKPAFSLFGPPTNPYAGVELSGWIIDRDQRISMEDSLRFAIKPDAYYDYYSNYFVMSHLHYLFGQITENGLVTRTVKTGAFSVTKHDFFNHAWTRLRRDNSVVSGMRAFLQTDKNPNDGREILSMVIATKDPSVKRITFIMKNTFYATTNWGPRNGWNVVASRVITPDWLNQSHVEVLIRYQDDRIIQTTLTIER